MNNDVLNHYTLRRRLLTHLLLVACLGFTTVRPPDITGSWRMTAHRVVPAVDGIDDLYVQFKDQYGGCQRDMGLTLNADKSLKMSPAGDCQNPLGNLVMKMAAKFMPSGKASWEATANKIILLDGKGQRREYDLQVSGTTMEWGFDSTEKRTTVRHTVRFVRD